jgi:hypothetical protein
MHGVRVQAMPLARHGSRFIRDVKDVTALLATKT